MGKNYAKISDELAFAGGNWHEVFCMTFICFFVYFLLVFG